MKYIAIILILLNFVYSQKSNKSVNAVRIEDNSIILDGKLDENIWKNADIATDFLLKDPIEFKPEQEKTEVMFAYDSKSFYIGAKMQKFNPEKIISLVSRRDNSTNSERIIVTIDTYNDQITSYTFAVTATGVRIDYYNSSDNEYDRDYSYDPVWTVKTDIGEDCWTAEFEIPFSQLRFNNITEQIWGLNMNRWNPTTAEDSYWVLIPKNSFGWSSKFGTITGLRNVVPSSRIEILPYFSGSYQILPKNETSNPFYKENDFSARGGMDVKMGLGSSYTLDATIYPDFGQVEVDPAVVNLSEFETIYDEKRPFFLEGANLFSSSRSFFYSRRVGSAPKFRNSEDFIEIPHYTDILGAAKISGRNNSGFSFAFLSSLTNSIEGKFHNLGSDSTYTMEVEPMSLFNVLSAQKEIDQNGSTIKFLQTSTERFFSESHLQEQLHQRAYTGGLEYLIRFNQSDYEIGGDFGYSYVHGSKQAILQTQRSSAHLFQRPDAEFYQIDPDKTDLSGLAGSFRIAKRAGENWLWNFSGSFISPEFELNDVGVLHRADDINTNATLTYRVIDPGEIIKQYNLNLYAVNSLNFEGITTGRAVSLSSTIGFTDYSNAVIQTSYDFESFSLSKTRGGPLMKNASRNNYKIGYSSAWSKPFQYTLNLLYASTSLNDDFYSVNGEFSLKTLGRLEIKLYFSYSNNEDSRQFINSMPAEDTETFGRRYVFGKIRQQTFSLPVRFNYAFSTDISLELYAAPFISVGKYSEIGELAKPSTYDLNIYGLNGSTIKLNSENKYEITKNNEKFFITNPDYEYISFRSNFVLKWEWLPGSTMFFVWQINKNQYENSYNEISANSFFDSISKEGLNSFALKISYWLPIN